MDKEQKKVALLIILLIAIAGVLVYFNRQRFLPKPGTVAPLPPPLPQLMFDAGERESLFGRKDFLGLDEFVTPVDPGNVGKVGSDQPFRMPVEEEEG